MSTTPDAVQPGQTPAPGERRAPGRGAAPPADPHADRPDRRHDDQHDDGEHGDGPHGDDPHAGTEHGDTPDGHTVPPARRRRLLQTIAVLAAVVLAVDQATKAWAVSALTEGERTDLVGDLLGLTLLYNPGAALSIATGMTWVLTLVAVVVVAVTVRASRRIGSRGWAVALGLLLGGAIGNLVDRFLREPGPARGHVVDFIAYADWFVGNVADIAIVGAAGLIMLLALRGIGMDGSREDAGRDPDRDDAHDPDRDPDAHPGPDHAGATHAAAEDRSAGGAGGTGAGGGPGA